MTVRDVLDFMWRQSVDQMHERINRHIAEGAMQVLEATKAERETHMIGPTVVMVDGNSELGQVLTKALCHHNQANEPNATQAEDAKVPYFRDEVYLERDERKVAAEVHRTAQQAQQREQTIRGGPIQGGASPTPMTTVSTTLDTTEQIIDALHSRTSDVEGRLMSVLASEKEPPPPTYPAEEGMVGRVMSLNVRLEGLLMRLSSLYHRVKV